MKEVEQTIFGYPEGNCLNACVASILEIPLEETPDLGRKEGPAWWDTWNDWLARRNLSLVYFPYSAEWLPKGYWILSVESPRLEGRTHSVVCLGPKIVWDPHPESSVIVGERKGVYLFYLLDPAREAR